MDNSTSFGVASNITGIAYLRIGEQEPTQLVEGDLLMLGQTLILTDGSRINFDNGLNFEGPAEMVLSNDMIADTATNTQEAEVSDITVDAVLAILAEGGDLLDSIEAPAAGLDGDDGAQGHSFIRLARIAENADTQDFVGGIPSAQAVGTPEDATDNINFAPVAVDDVIEGDEDSTIVIQVIDNDSDENGDDLTVIDVTLPTNGSAVINDDGSISYTPNENFNGTDSFEYTIDDGNGGTDTATVTVNVNPVNDAPVAGELDDLSGSDADNIIVDVSSAFSDVENDNLTYSASGLPVGLSINPDTGVISGTIDASASDQTNDDNNVQVYNVTVTANDGSDSTSTSFDWTINNTIPVAGNDSFSTLEDTGLIISASSLLSNDSDLDGDALSISAMDTSSANGGSINNNGNGTYTYTPAANYFGTDSFEYSITDNEGGSSTAAVNITVTAVSDLVDGNETNSVDEDTTLTVADGTAGDLLNNATSSDGAPITITQFVVAGDATVYTAGTTAAIAGVGALTINADGSYSFVPAAEYNGAVPQVTYTVSDTVNTDTSTLDLSVGAVSDLVDGNETNSVDEDTTLTVADGTAGDLLNNATSSDGAPITITQFVVAGDATVYTAGSTAAIAGVGALTINADGSYSFVPAAEYNGAVPQVTYTVSDTVNTDTSTLDLSVGAVSDLVDGNETNSVDEDTTLTVADGTAGDLLNNATSSDGAPITITQFVVAGDATVYTAGTTAAIAGVGALTINADGSYSFVPAAEYNGAVPQVTYTVSDTVNTDTSTLDLSVGAVSDLVDGNETNSVDEDTTLTVADGTAGDLLNNATSSDGAPITITQFVVAGDATVYTAGSTAAIAGVGALTINADGSYSFVPAAEYNGAVPQVTYTVSDTVNTDTSTLDLSVGAVSDLVDGNETNSVDEDTTLTVADGTAGDLLNNATSSDGAPITITQFVVAGDATVYTAGTTAAIAGVGALTINADGSYSFVPAAEYNGAVPQVTYTVSDTVNTDTSTLDLSVGAVSDLVDGNETNSVDEDTTLTVADGTAGDLLNNATSSDGAPITITQFVVAGDATVYTAGSTAAIAGVGALTINADGSYSFVPAAEYNGAVPQVTYTVSDTVNTDTSTLDLSVGAVSDLVDGNETNSVDEDTTLTVADGTAGDLLNNATSSDGAPITITQFVVAGDATVYTAGTTAAIAGVGALTINADGSYSFVPAAEYNGAVPQVTYTVSDTVNTDTSTLDLSVGAVSDLVDGNETNSVDEDTTLTVADGTAGDLLNNATSSDGAPITITQFVVAGDATVYTAGSTAAIAGVGALTINADGSYSFVPAAEYNGAVPQVTYTVSDTVNTDTSTLDLSVNTVNDVPDVTDDARSVTEDASPITLSVNGGITISDSDVGESSFNTASLAFTGRTNNGVTGPNTQLGSLNLNADGSYSFSVANADVQYLGLGDTIVQTFTVDSADGSATSTITITINGSNDSPTLVVDNVAIANVVGSYSGALSYTPGVDESDDQGFTDTFSANNALTWTNISSGFTFIYNPATLTGTATSDGTGETFFTVLLKPDGSYDFNLVTPEPITTATIPSLLTGIAGGSGLASYTFPSSNFGGQFDLVITGYTDNGATPGTLTISSTDLGINDNVVHGNKDDLLRFDVQQTLGNTDASVAALTIHISKTGGWKQTDNAEYKVFYTDGSNSGLQTEQWGSDQQITINMDIAKTVDYVELGAEGTFSFKIDGVALDYTVNNYPDDYQLDFSLTGSDGDAVTDTDTFSVAVNTTDTAAYHITGTSETDTVYGTSGDDTLSGNSDLVVDTFAWQLNEEGTPGSPAIDTVTDFNPAAVGDGGDALDIADLLDGENSGNLSDYLYVEKDGGDTVVHIKHDGGLAGDQANADQIITLAGVDLVTGFADQDAVIQNLLTNGKLITD